MYCYIWNKFCLNQIQNCLNFVTWSATPHFVAFLKFCVWFMVSPASFQVGCRSYTVPFVVDFAHRNDANGVWARTGDVLLDGPMSTVPRRYKNSGFFWLASSSLMTRPVYCVTAATSHWVNPFTAPACKVFGWKMHWRACKQYIFRSYNIYFRCYTFWWKSVRMPTRKINRKA